MCIQTISTLTHTARMSVLNTYLQYGSQSELFAAMHTVLTWNTIFDPHEGVVTPVSRSWLNFGPYVLFGNIHTYIYSSIYTLIPFRLCFSALIHSYTHTLIHSYTHTFILSYTRTHISYTVIHVIYTHTHSYTLIHTDWDNYFCALMMGLGINDRMLAYSNVIQITKAKTVQGFIPNYVRYAVCMCACMCVCVRRYTHTLTCSANQFAFDNVRLCMYVYVCMYVYGIVAQ